MKDSKLIDILSSFSKNEISQFDKFINSPYFVSGRDVTGLFKYLKKYHPEFNNPELDRETVYQKVYKDVPYNESKFKNVISALTSLAEQFLVHNHISSSKVEFSKILVNEYYQRDRNKLFTSNIKLLENLIVQEIEDNSMLIREQENAENLKEKFYLKFNDVKKASIANQKRIDLYFASFFINYIMTIKENIQLTDGYNIAVKNPLLDILQAELKIEDVIESLKELNADKQWLIELNYLALESVRNLHEEKYYLQFKEKFFENIQRLTYEDKYNFFNDLLYWSNRRYVHEPIERYRAESFEIYKMMFEHKVYSRIRGEYLDLLVYRNILFIAYTQKEYDWLNNFFDNYPDVINPEYVPNVRGIINAYFYFEEGRYEDALNSVNRINYDIPIYKLDIKNIQLKIYYELGLYEEAFSLIDTYKHFLNSNREFGESFKQMYYNYLDLLGRLLKAKVNGDKPAVEKIIYDTKLKEPVAFKLWLFDKADEILKAADE